MAIIRPFPGLRPPKELASKVASLPYDVINSEEARQLAKGNPYSFLHVTRPEIDLDPKIDIHSEEVYAKATENFNAFIKNGTLKKDPKPYYYLYEQTMGRVVQVGLVVTAAVDDYQKEVIKKHELTRKDKEEDRTRHVEATNGNNEPVFYTYRAKPEIDTIVSAWIKKTPEYDFTADDGIRHRFWVVDDPATIDTLTKLFAQIPTLYVSDGHHRSAAASNLCTKLRKQNPNYTGNEPFNYFLTVIFPHNQLFIMDYNRIVKDLNGMTSDEFLKKVSEKFDIRKHDKPEPYKPQKKHEFGMYLDKTWYVLTAKTGFYNENDPIDSLDVQILQNHLLSPLLGINDPRTDKRIDFVGGIRGLKELERRVDETGFKVAFSMFATSIEDLIRVADAGKIMPPKSTWFEPKLRSGLIVHWFNY